MNILNPAKHIYITCRLIDSITYFVYNYIFIVKISKIDQNFGLNFNVNLISRIISHISEQILDSNDR